MCRWTTASRPKRAIPLGSRERDGRAAAVTRQQSERGTQSAAGAGAADDHLLGIEPERIGVVDRPYKRRIAIPGWSGVRRDIGGVTYPLTQVVVPPEPGVGKVPRRSVDGPAHAAGLQAVVDFRDGEELATDLSGLPPAYISVVEFDPLRDEGIAYAQARLACHVPTELHLFPGTFHGSSLVDAAVTRPEVESRAVLARALGSDRK